MNVRNVWQSLAKSRTKMLEKKCQMLTEHPVLFFFKSVTFLIHPDTPFTSPDIPNTPNTPLGVSGVLGMSGDVKGVSGCIRNVC